MVLSILAVYWHGYSCTGCVLARILLYWLRIGTDTVVLARILLYWTRIGTDTVVLAVYWDGLLRMITLASVAASTPRRVLHTLLHAIVFPL